jgi:hypothetical protein
MEFTLYVDQREESTKQRLKVTCRQESEDAMARFNIMLWIDVTADPRVRDFQIGDRLVMTLEPVPVAEIEPPPPAPGVPEATDLVEDEVMF